jgi:hypothetical protein
MSWLYSRALEVAYWEANCSDGAPSALSSVNHTPLAFLPPDKMTAFSRLSRSGMTFKPLTGDHGADLLTWYLGGFHARTSPSLAREKVSLESEAGCGSTWRESLAKLDLDTSSWRTPHSSLLGDLELFSETWPRWGMMRNGECWALDTPELVIDGIEFGYWATPAARDYKDTPGMSKTREKGRSRVDQTARQVYASLDGSELFTPPTAKETWMTTCSFAADAQENMRNANALGLPWMTSMTTKSETESNTPPKEPGGLLSADWSEWLMGWPIGWTDLKPLATVKFQQWQLSHGEH